MKKIFWAIEDKKGKLKNRAVYNTPDLFRLKCEAQLCASRFYGERPVKVELRKVEE